jgi:hypothetical protein
MNRRRFLQVLGIGLACLQLRLRPESAIETDVIDAFTFEDFNAALERMFRVAKHPPEPVFLFPSAKAAQEFQRQALDYYIKRAEENKQ